MLGKRHQMRHLDSCPRFLLTEGLLGSSPARLMLAQTKVPQKSSCLPKLFLRLPTKIQASDYPLTLAKPFFHFSLVDNKEVRFYHLHWEFLRVLGQNPPLSARLLDPPSETRNFIGLLNRYRF